MKPAALLLLLLPAAARAQSLEIVSVKPARPIEGAEAQLRLRFSNASPGLLAIHPGRARYGSLENHQEVVVLNAMTQAATAPVFYMASDLVPPGQAREEVVSADAVEDRACVEREAAAIDAGARVYASVGHAGAQSSFSLIDEAELAKKIAAARAGKDAELIILGNSHARFLKASKEVKNWPREFSYAQATQGLPGKPRAARWSNTYRGWLLDLPEETRLLTKKTVSIFPSGSYELLRESEKSSGALRLHLAKPESTQLGRAFKIVPGDGMYARGNFVEIPAGRLLEALAAARAEKLAVVRTKYFLEDYYYELRPASR